MMVGNYYCGRHYVESLHEQFGGYTPTIMHRIVHFFFPSSGWLHYERYLIIKDIPLDKFEY